MIRRVNRVPRVRQSRYAYWFICLAGRAGDGLGYCSLDAHHWPGEVRG